MSLDLKLSAEAAAMARDTKAYVIVKIDSHAKVQMAAQGNIMELSYMKDVIQDFILKVMSGEVHKRDSNP